MKHRMNNFTLFFVYLDSSFSKIYKENNNLKLAVIVVKFTLCNQRRFKLNNTEHFPVILNYLLIM